MIVAAVNGDGLAWIIILVLVIKGLLIRGWLKK